MQAYKRITVVIEPVDGLWKLTHKNTFGGVCRNLLVEVETAAATVEISFNGKDLHGEIGGTGQLTQLLMKGFPVSEIWLRSAAGGEVIQVWAWGD